MGRGLVGPGRRAVGEHPAGGITGEEIASRDEAALAYPGSVLIHEQVWGEGEHHGHDGMETSASITRWRRVEADPDAILDWYRDRLVARGWTYGGRSQSGDMYDYIRNDRRENYSIVIRQRELWMQPWMWPPPGAFDEPGTNYDIEYSAHSR
ncbi:MAG: hypothetical protein ACRDY0_08170 [Acidimicrobiales bacterium]